MNSPNTLDSWINRSIGDRQRYRLDKRLGMGGMGDVFLAMDTLLGRQVALKLLKDTLVASEDLRKRFEREVAVSAALKSNHIVEVCDYGVTSEGYPFYVMEYLRGETLGQLLRQQQSLSVERTVSIIAQVCEGLHLAHEGVILWRDFATSSESVKVVHRDLKPDNIFLVPTALGELVKILDFGIAKIRKDSVESTELTSAFIGTSHYAAPEQLEGDKDIDGRADIYSLGMILYEILSGTDPFGLGLYTNNISRLSWAFAHTSKQPVPLRSQPNCEQLSPELEAVVMRCLQKEPNERFASVEELKQSLQAAFTHQNSSVPHTHANNEDLTVSPAALGGSQPSPIVTDTQAPELVTSPSRKFSWLLTGGGITVAMGVITATYIFLASSKPSETTNIDEIVNLQAQANYSLCVTKAKTVSETSSLYAKAQELLYRCQLKQANQLAAENKLAQAIAAASTIPKNSPVSSKAQELSQQWSNSIMTTATDLFQNGKLDAAIAQIQEIPKTSSAYQKAQAAIVQWRKDWKVSETQFNAAKTALDEEKWQVAIDESHKIPNITFWKDKIKPVIQEAHSQIVKAEAEKIKAQQNPQLQQPTSNKGISSPVLRIDSQPVTRSQSKLPSPTPSTQNSSPNVSPRVPTSSSERGWEDSPNEIQQPDGI
ncbi:serine/threonine protein kinase [Scytonema sp. NUACC26]|uniref:serine/threonine protein kinase n=1 Tax=Scytonema sp. NUACC26 TaxID=3140176 RepID=UPI0034DC7D28